MNEFREKLARLLALGNIYKKKFDKKFEKI
jgi:hypothetical protein